MTGGQPGHSRSTTSAMTISDQSTTTGFSDSMPVLHQREISDASAMSGLVSGDMPGLAGAPSQCLRCSLSMASTAVAGRFCIINCACKILLLIMGAHCAHTSSYAWHHICRRVKLACEAFSIYMQNCVHTWTLAGGLLREGITSSLKHPQILAGSAMVPLSSQNLEGALPHASLESAGLSAIIGESDSSQSLADSISTTSGPALSVSEAMASDTLAAMAASMAQSSQGTLWATNDLAARCPIPSPPPTVPAVLLTF